MDFRYLEDGWEEESKPLISKKGKRIIGLCVLVLIVFWGVRFVLMFGAQICAAYSVQTLEDNFYSMEYKGDYGLDDMLAKGGVSSDAELRDFIVE